MGETYMSIHHTATSMGDFLNICCPHCGKEIELTAKLLPDDDTIVVSYGDDEESDEPNQNIKKT